MRRNTCLFKLRTAKLHEYQKMDVIFLYLSIRLLYCIHFNFNDFCIFSSFFLTKRKPNLSLHSQINNSQRVNFDGNGSGGRFGTKNAALVNRLRRHPFTVE